MKRRETSRSCFVGGEECWELFVDLYRNSPAAISSLWLLAICSHSHVHN